MIFVKGHLIRKAWGMKAHTPEHGSTMIRNPPATAFTPPTEEDIPAYAHDGHGGIIPGEWQSGDHGERHWVTSVGSYQHGIDAAVTRLGWFLKKYKKDDANPVDIINQAITNFNKNHTSHKGLDDLTQGDHYLPPFKSMAWRKIRASMLPPGGSTREMSDRATKTKNNTLITHYTNKNIDGPMGRFVESGAIPFNDELQHILEDEYGLPFNVSKQLSFVQKPYIYAREMAPQGRVEPSYQEHPADISPKQMAGAPDNYFSEQTPVFTHSVAHHLPDIMYYPHVDVHGTKTGGKQNFDQEAGLYSMAERAIDKALESGIENIPDVPATINIGTMGSPEMIQRPLREILQDPAMKRKLIEDMSHVPAMMFLFGRSNQGNFKKQFDRLMEIHGAGEEGLSYDQHSQFFKPGAGGNKGRHLSAARLMALAHKSGADEDDPERSKIGTHPITSEELSAFNVNYNENLMGQVDRFRGIIEALADHQADAQGHPVKMALGDINTKPMQGMTFANYPVEGEDVALEPHMDAYLHGVEDFADASSMPVLPESTSATTVDKPVTSPPPTGRTPFQRVGVVPQGPPATPLDPRFQQFRPSIAEQDPQRFREMMAAGGGGRVSEAPSPELTPIEARAQRSLSDPRQQLLDQYMRSEDAHLPVMDRVMKALERMQQEEAGFDGIKINSNLNTPHALAKHVGLTASEVVTINQTMGDWHNIAKSYNVDAKVVKVIKTNMR